MTHEPTPDILEVLSSHEQTVRDRERRRISALVGPGHCHDLAHDAPADDTDPRWDSTGFSDGLL